MYPPKGAAVADRDKMQQSQSGTDIQQQREKERDWMLREHEPAEQIACTGPIKVLLSLARS